MSGETINPAVADALIIAIFERALFDLHARRPAIRRDASEFLSGHDIDVLAEHLKLDPQACRDALKRRGMLEASCTATPSP